MEVALPGRHKMEKVVEESRRGEWVRVRLQQMKMAELSWNGLRDPGVETIEGPWKS